MYRGTLNGLFPPAEAAGYFSDIQLSTEASRAEQDSNIVSEVCLLVLKFFFSFFFCLLLLLLPIKWVSGRV